MKRTIILYFLAILTLTLMQVSCDRHRHIVRGFVDESQDSILIDLSEYAHPASKIELFDVKKCNGYYYFRFDGVYRDDYDGPYSILMAASENGLKAKHIPLPDGVDDVRQIFERNDTLVMKSDDERFYSFDPKKWKWSPTTPKKEDKTTSYEDDDWMVRYVDHGEFGYVSWFIDKHSLEEYAFVELGGRIRRIGNTFIVVTPTRIYEIPDPTIGFHCDSATRYEKAQEAHLINYHFYNAGYKPIEHFVNPVVRFDDWDISGEDYILEDGFRFINEPYFTAFDIIDEKNTVIVNSFCASDTLFCVLNTPSGLELAKLEDARLSTVHHFHKSIGSNIYHRYIFVDFPYDYPSLRTRYKYRDKSNPTDERLLLLINTEAGVSELIDLAHNGNTVLKICYSPV